MALSSSFSSLKGLIDYSQHKARVRQHDTYVKTTALGSSESSLDFEQELANSSHHRRMTVQEFRERLSREDENGDDEITFCLRLARKRRRDGSTHSVSSRQRYSIKKNDSGQLVSINVEEEAPTTPSRSLSGKSKILVRTSSSEQLGNSTEELSSYGYSPLSPRRAGKRPGALPGALRDQIIQEGEALLRNKNRNKSRQVPVMQGLLLDPFESEQSASEKSISLDSPRRLVEKATVRQEAATRLPLPNVHNGESQEVSESEQTEASASEDRSATFESGSSLSLSSSVTSGGRSKSRNTTTNSSVTSQSSSMSSVKLKASCQQTIDNRCDADEIKPKPLARKERPIFTGFTAGHYPTRFPIRSPSDSDESFSSFAQKYSRFSKHNSGDSKTDKSDPKSEVDSAMDFNESFSSIASFAEDADWATESIAALERSKMSLLDDVDLTGDRDNEEELSVSEQSPDSVIFDLNSASTSANSQSLSPRSSSKASKTSSISRERRKKFEVPLNNIKESTTDRKQERRGQKSRHELTDGCSVGSARSRRSGGSWLSRRSTAQSTNSRFSRLEEYLNSTSERNLNVKDGGSKFSGDDKDGISTTSSLTMGTFPTNETKDSEWKKLSEVVESEETPNPALIEDENSPLQRINSNPFLAADRRKNVPVRNACESRHKAMRVWTRSTEPQAHSPVNRSHSKTKITKYDPSSSSELPFSLAKATTPPTKTPSPTPRNLAHDRLSPFTSGKDSLPDIVCCSPSRPIIGKSISEVSPMKRRSPGKAPSRASSAETIIKGKREIPIASSPLSRRPTREKRALGPERVATNSCDHQEIAKVMSRLSIDKSVSGSSTEVSHHVTDEKKVGGSKVASASAKNFSKPSQPMSKGISVFNPSSTSTVPKKQTNPFSVSDRAGPAKVVNQASSSGPDRDNNSRLTIEKSAKPPSKDAVQAKPSKVQSYLKMCRERNQEATSRSPSARSSGSRSEKKGGDITRKTPADIRDSEATPKSPVRTKSDRENTVEGIVRSPTSSKSPRSKPSQIDDSAFSHKNTRSKSSRETTKLSRPTPAVSRLRIDDFLEKNKHDSEDGDVFKEPVPSPWRPSTQSGRSRLRMADSTSRASSIASSRCSTASRKTGALSMFQPHRQVSVEPALGHQSPQRSPKKGISVSLVSESSGELSLVEVRKRMFQSSMQSDAPKQQNTRSSANQRQTEDKKSIRLPTADEICTRVSSWNVKALTHDGG